MKISEASFHLFSIFSCTNYTMH